MHTHCEPSTGMEVGQAAHLLTKMSANRAKTPAETRKLLVEMDERVRKLAELSGQEPDVLHQKSVLLRFMDEAKDIEKDKLGHPERPLPRGLVSLSAVTRGIYVMFTLLLAVSIACFWLNTASGLLWPTVALRRLPDDSQRPPRWLPQPAARVPQPGYRR